MKEKSNSLNYLIFFLLGKTRRLKQAKEQAADEIERYRQESERKFKEFEFKVIFFLIHLKIELDKQNVLFNYSTWDLAMMLLQRSMQILY